MTEGKTPRRLIVGITGAAGIVLGMGALHDATSGWIAPCRLLAAIDALALVAGLQATKQVHLDEPTE